MVSRSSSKTEGQEEITSRSAPSLVFAAIREGSCECRQVGGGRNVSRRGRRLRTVPSVASNTKKTKACCTHRHDTITPIGLCKKIPIVAQHTLAVRSINLLSISASPQRRTIQAPTPPAPTQSPANPEKPPTETPHPTHPPPQPAPP